ncbi:MAG: hypothetical protein HKM93_04215 [Desulfobacteraceae bacterium]|nr:hypothetical protein [Desulfobacteraceae bacterium]
MAKKTFTISGGDAFYVQSKKVEMAELDNLPGNIREKFEDAFRSGQKEVTIRDEINVVESFSDGSIDNRSELSIEKTLSILEGIKDSYKLKQIKPAEYEKMILGVIEDYLAAIDHNQKIHFVVNGILDSEFKSYLSNRMLNKLRGSIIESVNNKS